MPKLTSVRDLLIQELKDLYSAESQLSKAFPKMVKAASNQELKEAFSRHSLETKEHLNRLESIMTSLQESPRGKKCAAMEGLLEEGKEVMDGDALPEIKDLALINSAQKVEHYEMAGYGCARTLAEMIGENDIAKTLQSTLDEEGATDKLLTEITADIDIEFSTAVAEETKRS